MEVQQFLNSHLTAEERQDLQVLVRYREWTSLLKLFRRLEAQSQLEFEGFKKPEEAFEARGKLNGTRLALQIVTHLYGGQTNGSASETRSGPAGRNADTIVSGYTVPTNPADEPASDASY